MQRWVSHARFLLASLWLIGVLAGCGSGAASDAGEGAGGQAQSHQMIAPAGSPAPAGSGATRPTPIPGPIATDRPSPTPVPRPLAVALSSDLPQEISTTLRTALDQIDRADLEGQNRPIALVGGAGAGDLVVAFGPANLPGETVEERFYAAVVPFDTVPDDVSLGHVQAHWQGKADGPLYVTEDPALLAPILGPFAGSVVSADKLLATLQEHRKAIGIVPFDQLDPTYKVLWVNGVNVLSNQLDPASYPLAAAVKVRGDEAEAMAPLLAKGLGATTNRAADKLTTLIMTGVTAMSRDTAQRMEQRGVIYPALIISDTLAAADITHVSNEVPFLDDCKVNATEDNLVLCSNTSYWKALEAIGTDIVGLSGNHVNDFGYDGARRSLKFYRDNKIPIYGSGLNIKEACAPLMWEHNGNTFAFIAALAWWPETAWATDEQPGACYYYDNKEQIKKMVEDLAKKVDVVAVELQYFESYDPGPTPEQVKEFREIRDWGADIVTGVQSHVPQAMKPYGSSDPGGPGIIVYGLGNLFFDQMWSWETRTELYARHTIYDGRLLGTEILTGVLENAAQPRWATLKERAEILKRIFKAAPKR